MARALDPSISSPILVHTSWAELKADYQASESGTRPRRPAELSGRIAHAEPLITICLFGYELFFEPDAVSLDLNVVLQLCGSWGS